MLICYNYTNFFKEYIIAKCNQKVEWLRCRNCEDKCEKDLSERGLRVVEECQEKCKQAWRDACDEKVNPLHDCHRWCEREYPNWSKLIERSTCKAKCNKWYESPSQESAPIVTSDVLRDIGDNFYTLADLVSVL
ncbi:hypothetical protein [Wolbachia endosymbiont (group B) of Longitarsus flavicornis]|uniref:hypothetical protein n=1 Tax=Wolbachia endosymbiont (group B) of Longitarsus flavicornis TaxID=3066135 RepID=UPI00333FD5F0